MRSSTTPSSSASSSLLVLGAAQDQSDGIVLALPLVVAPCPGEIELHLRDVRVGQLADCEVHVHGRAEPAMEEGEIDIVLFQAAWFDYHPACDCGRMAKRGPTTAMTARPRPATMMARRSLSSAALTSSGRESAAVSLLIAPAPSADTARATGGRPCAWPSRRADRTVSWSPRSRGRRAIVPACSAIDNASAVHRARLERRPRTGPTSPPRSLGRPGAAHGSNLAGSCR